MHVGENTLVPFVFLWECKASFSLLLLKEAGRKTHPGRGKDRLQSPALPTCLFFLCLQSRLGHQSTKRWLWESKRINVCRKAITNAEWQCRATQAGESLPHRQLAGPPGPPGPAALTRTAREDGRLGLHRSRVLPRRCIPKPGMAKLQLADSPCECTSGSALSIP